MTHLFTRRRFVTAGTAAACGTLLPASFALAASGGELTASRFRPYIDTRFTARSLSTTTAPEIVVWLRVVRPLDQVAPGLRPEIAQERSFELVFSTDAANAAQEVYAMTHPEVGTFDVFLVPSRDRKQLSATFNRLP